MSSAHDLLSAARWRGATLAVNIRNLFDADPPFYNNPTGYGFDPTSADIVGRFREFLRAAGRADRRARGGRAAATTEQRGVGGIDDGIDVEAAVVRIDVGEFAVQFAPSHGWCSNSCGFRSSTNRWMRNCAFFSAKTIQSGRDPSSFALMAMRRTMPSDPAAVEIWIRSPSERDL